MTEFSYSDAGQIREVRTSSGSWWRYAYDGLGRRVGKRHTSVDGRVLDEVVFGWDGNDLVLQANTALTARGQVPAGASSTWVWTYHPGSGDVLSQQVDHTTPSGPTDVAPARADVGVVGSVGGWSQSQVDTEFYAIVSDLAGAPTELVDPVTGDVAGRARRSLWGATVWAGAGTPLGFTGQHYDPESGLAYNRFRYYNPVTASYTSSDPLGVGPNPGSATAYVHNPLTWVDPLGLIAHLKGKGILAKNKINGDAFRDRFAAGIRGSSKEVTISDAPFGPRRYDVAAGVPPHMFENKVGRTFFGRSIRQQVANDVALLNSGRVESVTWVFERSPITGRVGASKRLLQHLEAGGINVSMPL